jgi:hypothetical protein
MGRIKQARNLRFPTTGNAAQVKQVLDLDRCVPAFIFIVNKLSRSATLTYPKRLAVNVTEWRIVAQFAIEPDISVARFCHVVSFDTGPVSRTLATMEERGLASWIVGWQTSLPNFVG